MMNMPEVKLGIVAVSRDCFPITLSESRRKAVAAAYKGRTVRMSNCSRERAGYAESPERGAGSRM